METKKQNVLLCDDDLYYLSLAQSESKAFYSYMLWHSQLRHASYEMLRKMKNGNFVYGLETFSSNENRSIVNLVHFIKAQ